MRHSHHFHQDSLRTLIYNQYKVIVIGVKTYTVSGHLSEPGNQCLGRTNGPKKCAQKNCHHRVQIGKSVNVRHGTRAVLSELPGGGP